LSMVRALCILSMVRALCMLSMVRALCILSMVRALCILSMVRILFLLCDSTNNTIHKYMLCHHFASFVSYIDFLLRTKIGRNVRWGE
jgi:hypothetical protein